MNLIAKHFSGNLSQPMDLSGVESCSSLALLLEQKAFSEKSQLLVASNKDLEKVKSFLSFKNPKRNWYDLPDFPKPKSPYFELARIKRRRWQSWASITTKNSNHLFLATPQALLKKTNIFLPICILKKNEIFDDSLLKNYQEVYFVEKEGDYSSRGFLIDIFSPAYSTPLRIQLFGNKIESIHLLDKNFKKRQTELDQALVPSLWEWSFKGEDRKQLCNYLKQEEDKLNVQLPSELFQKFSRGELCFGFENLINSLDETCSLDYFQETLNICLFEPEKTKNIFLEEKVKIEGENPFFTEKNLFLGWEHIESATSLKVRSCFPENLSKKNLLLPDNLKHFSSTLFKKSEDLKQDLKNIPVSNIVFVGDRIEDLKKILFKEQILKEEDTSFFEGKNLIFLKSQIKESFFCKGDTAYLRAEDFLLQKKQHLNHFTFFKQRAKALEFSNLDIGDLVVHRQHGVGQFNGLKSLNVSGKREDFIILVYKDGDKLFVPAYKASQVKKYSKKRSGQITKNLLDRLGNPKLWEKKKSQAQEHIQSLAIELIELYRVRKQKKRKVFSPVIEELAEFSKSFPFTETLDQIRVIQEIMTDMDAEQPMDRLLTADTGFGKTEVALRACFRALKNGTQVCFLAPTTVLTLQHYQNFKLRFKNYPFKIALLNSFLTKKQKEEIFQKVHKGEIDFLISTHSVFNPQLIFKNLGLLVLDEEHRFGVRQKERLFRFRKNLDVLSLSATPIPRTLNMALTGIKDISVITKAPAKRKSVKIIMKAWDEGASDVIVKACLKEKARGGQILFVHNRTKTLYQRAEYIQSLLPDFKIAVAKGQMDNLDKIILDFFDKKYDILLSTNIIESGMDIPQANTLFIDRVHEMGLSQIYQLKGRVGRGEEQAYCYLLFPERDRLSKLAQERLALLEKYTGLGTGIQLALHDLENRGAGALFGSEQSGHLQKLGDDLYFEILNEQLKDQKELSIEPDIQIPVNTGIPRNYINEAQLRLLYYKSLSEAEGEETRLAIKCELFEEFGPFPEELEHLFFLLDIREICKKLFIRDFKATNKYLTLVFDEQTKISPDKILQMLEQKELQMLGHQGLKLTFQSEDIFQEIKSFLKELSSD